MVFMPVRVMHRLSVEFCAMFGRVLTAGRIGAVISLPIVEIVIDMTVKASGSMEPRPCANKYSA